MERFEIRLEIYDGREPTQREIEIALTDEDTSPDWWRDVLLLADPKDVDIVTKQGRNKFIYYRLTDGRD